MMTKDGVRRIATSDGAVLISARYLARAADLLPRGAAEPPYERLFDAQFWSGRGELEPVSGGRGSAWFVAPDGDWVLRHGRRGGLIAHISTDAYVWAGETRVRAFAEYRLLLDLAARGLPVPSPVGARYARRGLVYRCELITERIVGARSLSAQLALAPLDETAWRDVGAIVARLHGAGANHADLNAHNILLDAAGRVSVIDFDRGRLLRPSNARHPAAWAQRNLARLQRSLTKMALSLPQQRYTAVTWRWLIAGYTEAGSAPG